MRIYAFLLKIKSFSRDLNPNSNLKTGVCESPALAIIKWRLGVTPFNRLSLQRYIFTGSFIGSSDPNGDFNISINFYFSFNSHFSKLCQDVNVVKLRLVCNIQDYRHKSHRLTHRICVLDYFFRVLAYW